MSVSNHLMQHTNSEDRKLQTITYWSNHQYVQYLQRNKTCSLKKMATVEMKTNHLCCFNIHCRFPWRQQNPGSNGSISDILKACLSVGEKMSSKALESVAVPVIAHKRKRNQKCRTTSFLDRRNKILNILGEVRMESCALFRNFTRMTSSNFELLLQLIEH
jgi:hypothetical protein